MLLRSMQFYNTHVRKLLGTDLHLFELSVWIQAVAQAMVSVFLPIIMWKLGLSIPRIFEFYLLFNAIDVPLNFVARAYIRRFGARSALILAIFAELSFYILLYSFGGSWTELLLMAALLATYDTFYWVGNVYMFVSSAHGSIRIKKDISALNATRIVGGIVAPMIGALLLIYADQRTLIFIATLLMLASLIPLFKMRHLKFLPEGAIMSMRQFFSHPLEKINFGLEIFSAIREEIESVIWPFFIFFLYQSVRYAAFVPITIALAALITNYIAAKIVIRDNIYKLVSISAFTIAAAWIVRLIFVGVPWVLYATIFTVALFAILIDLPLEVSIFERGKRSDLLSASTYLNLFRMGGRGLLYLVMILVLHIGPVFPMAFGMSVALIIGVGVVAARVSRRRDEISRIRVEPLEEKAI